MEPFNIRNGVPSDDEILAQVKQYADRASALMPRLDKHDSLALKETVELRRELNVEYDAYQKRPFQIYRGQTTLFSKYLRWIDKVVRHTAGALSYQKAHSFAYDVGDYQMLVFKAGL